MMESIFLLLDKNTKHSCPHPNTEVSFDIVHACVWEGVSGMNRICGKSALVFSSLGPIVSFYEKLLTWMFYKRDPKTMFMSA